MTTLRPSQGYLIQAQISRRAGFGDAGLTDGACILLVYLGTLVLMAQEKQDHPLVEVERVQTGVRLEKRMLKVLKAIAEQKDMTLGDLLEGIVLHAFEGKAPFSPQTLKEIEQFKSLYGMTLKAADSHHLKERKR
ncbi:MAG: hypothetical protein WBQ95_19905 [Terracidiphilus sp.]